MDVQLKFPTSLVSSSQKVDLRDNHTVAFTVLPGIVAELARAVEGLATDTLFVQ